MCVGRVGRHRHRVDSGTIRCTLLLEWIQKKRYTPLSRLMMIASSHISSAVRGCSTSTHLHVIRVNCVTNGIKLIVLACSLRPTARGAPTTVSFVIVRIKWKWKTPEWIGVRADQTDGEKKSSKREEKKIVNQNWSVKFCICVGLLKRIKTTQKIRMHYPISKQCYYMPEMDLCREMAISVQRIRFLGIRYNLLGLFVDTKTQFPFSS